MRIHRLYATPDGESHWSDIEVDFVRETQGGRFSEAIPATSITFREVPPSYSVAHPAPRRMYIINLEGAVEMTASDGEMRRIGPGEVFLVEDTTGKGHSAKAATSELRRCVVVALE